MSNISPLYQARTFTPPVLPTAPVLDLIPPADTPARLKRSLGPQASPAWTLPALPTTTAEAAATADRTLQTALGSQALVHAADRRVNLAADSTIFPLFDAYRHAFNTPELQDWFRKKGIALSTVVIKPHSVTGSVTRDGVSRVQTFTTGDASGWWEASARLRAAAQGLDPEGAGLPYAGPNGSTFSRNAVMRWYGVQPPGGNTTVAQAQQALAATDWSAADKKTELESRVQTARQAIGALDERAYLASVLSQHIADKPDDETVTLAELQVPVSSTSVLARSEAGTVALGDALQCFGLPLPKTVGEVRNAVRWLTTALPPPAPPGNYSGQLGRTWVPGDRSAADRAYLIGLSKNAGGESGAFNPLDVLNTGGILDRHSPQELRQQADHLISQLLSDPLVLLVGDSLAFGRQFLGASGTRTLSDTERAQWIIAAIKLQIDPEAPGRPGTVAGYDLYQPGNSGRSMAAVRGDLETHLVEHHQLNAKTAVLVAHLFLASTAPEFVVRDLPDTLRIGSPEWADLRKGTAFAERQGGAGASRAMSYAQLMALSRLDPRTLDEAAVLDNYGMDALLDWGVMQGIYPQPADGRYTPQMYQQANLAFAAQHEQLVQALKQFNVPLPTREKRAIENLQAVFPDYSVAQLKGMRVFIANPNKRRNETSSEPVARPLFEAYMSGDLVKDRWMLLAPGQPLPVPPKRQSPFDFNRGPSKAEQDAIDANVQALNAKIALLPDVQAQLPAEVDTYLGNLKQGLSTVTKRMIANLPLADRQALEWGKVELFALREQVDDVPKLDQTPDQVEERRGRKGTVIRCEHLGVISYFEVFADKLLITKRDDLPDTLTLGGELQTHVKVYGPWAPTVTQLQNGTEQPFDFMAYSSDAVPRPGVKSPRIIIEKLGDTLPPASTAEQGDTHTGVPNSFSSARTQLLVDRIMQGNFVHHRDSVLKLAQGQLPLEQQRALSDHRDRLLLGMIPFIGAIMDLAQGNIVEGTRGLIIDTVGAIAGGATTTLKPLIKATRVVAPFGAKSFRILEKGVSVVSGFLNPLDGSSDLLIGATKGIFSLPKLLSKATRPVVLTTLGSVEEKMRTFLGVDRALKQSFVVKHPSSQAVTHDGHNHSVPVQAAQIGDYWYATDPTTRLPIGTPLDGFKPRDAVAA